MRKLLVLLGPLLAPSVVHAQAIVWDPDTCWTCRDTRQHFAAGAALDLLARGPWVAASWRDRAWKRVALASTVGATYEFMQSFEVKQSGQRGPGYGFGLKDLGADIAGAIAAEGAYALIRKVIKSF